MAELIGDYRVDLTIDTRSFETSLARAAKLGEGFARSLTRAFGDVAIRGRSLEDTLRALALSLSRLAFRAAFKPLEQFIGSAFSQLFSGFTGFAKGGVAAPRLPVPFAEGGVVARPTAFTFGRGQLGVMGERGAEAILPLARGADGRLGVRADGARALTINFHVTSPDAESFLRSQSQIAAALNRLVGQGERNL